MTNFVPIVQEKPQRESIYEQLRQAILSGAIEPNERLVETTYAGLFNGIPFVPQKLRNFPAILEHRKIQTNPL